MGTGRKMRTKPVTRPKKSVRERKRREAVHKKRLMALGVPEERLRHMTSEAIRKALIRPAKTAAAAAAS